MTCSGFRIRIAGTLIIAGLLLWVSVFFRYDLRIIGGSPIAYRLDRWTGEIVLLRGDDAVQLNMANTPQFIPIPNRSDILAEARKRWPKLKDWKDDQILQSLAEPQVFRLAFPEYKDFSEERILAVTVGTLRDRFKKLSELPSTTQYFTAEELDAIVKQPTGTGQPKQTFSESEFEPLSPKQPDASGQRKLASPAELDDFLKSRKQQDASGQRKAK